jgi:hypothetical protein
MKEMYVPWSESVTFKFLTSVETLRLNMDFRWAPAKLNPYFLESKVKSDFLKTKFYIKQNTQSPFIEDKLSFFVICDENYPRDYHLFEYVIN